MIPIEAMIEQCLPTEMIIKIVSQPGEENRERTYGEKKIVKKRKKRRFMSENVA